MYNIPQPNYLSTINYISGSNDDSIKILESNYGRAYDETKGYYKKFITGEIEADCFAVWNFLKTNITYKADGTVHHKIKLPNRFFADKEGDCKSFSLFTAAILGHYYKVCFRYTSYRNDPTPTHVYCIVEDNTGKKIIVDAVYTEFNKQKLYTNKIDHCMKISTLSGFDDLTNEQIKNKIQNWSDKLNNYDPGSSERTQIRKRIADLVAEYKSRTILGIEKKQSAGKVVKKVALAPGRNAFLLLVKLNVRGIAKRLSNALTKNEKGTKEKWTKLGGSFASLKKAIAKGKDKKPLLGQSKKNKELSGHEGIGSPELAVAMTAALPVLIAVGNILKTIKGDQTADGDMAAEEIASGGDPTSADNMNISDLGTGADHTGFSLSPIMIGVMAVAGYFLFIKKK